MEGIINNEKMAFCTTCMNRLNHLQQTLEKNIQNNYLIERVEFVLLDYNSQDGLDKWVYNQMKKYIDEGILVYYKTTEPVHYLRSHSRNMAFRLANATILCNLDADNFLGRGFASFMLQEFAKNDNIFYTNNYSFNDTFGRVCVRSSDFMSIRGYNEALKSYGYEDNDFLNRLALYGLKPMSFHNPEFYHIVVHSDTDRISEEYMAKNLYKMYIIYINPYTSGILLLYNDHTTEQYTLVANWHLFAYTNTNSSPSSIYDSYLNEKIRAIIQDDILKGRWSKNDDKLFIEGTGNGYCVREDSLTIDTKDNTFYAINDDDFKAKVLVTLTSAINFNEVSKLMKDQSGLINPNGFGKGIVFKNFDESKKIILS
jgi:hypothetical protein